MLMCVQESGLLRRRRMLGKTRRMVSISSIGNLIMSMRQQRMTKRIQKLCKPCQMETRARKRLTEPATLVPDPLDNAPRLTPKERLESNRKLRWKPNAKRRSGVSFEGSKKL
jgi:hypothetical protein